MPSYPQIFRVRQRFERPRVEDVATEVESQLASLQLARTIRPKQTVAVTAGSRGIADIHVITRAIVQHLKSIGAQPFLVPAMGSHGGATAEGQQQVLASFGITEEFCGCPIRSSMETVVICETVEGFAVHFDRHAYEADHVLVCGRVKPHTDFSGEIESGLMKMMLIGLGKQEGAKIYHRAIHDHSFDRIVRSVASRVLAQCRIVAGLAIVENGYDETAKIEAVAPAQFEEREKQLLVLAKRWMPRLPFKQVDLLVIDEIGKNISGSGMDTNVVGRKQYHHKAGNDEFPKVRFIAVRRLTEATHGNAIGIGYAEFCRQQALDGEDRQKTIINGLTSGNVAATMIPPAFTTDGEMLDAALSTIGLRGPADARLLWVRDTLHLAEVECAAAYWNEARERDDLEILTEPRPLPVMEDGNLPETMASLAQMT